MQWTVLYQPNTYWVLLPGGRYKFHTNNFLSCRKWLLALLVSAMFPAWALDAVRPLLIVRSEGYFPPHEMVVDGKLTGLHIDLIEAAAARMQVQVVIQTYPWLRAITMLQRGDADAISYMGKTPEREQFGYFEEGNRLSAVQNGFFVLKANAAKVVYTGDMNQLRPYSIGQIRGRRSFHAFDHATYLNKDENAGTEEALLKMLVGGRFDIAMAPIARTKYIAKTMGLDTQLVALKPYGPMVDTYLVFSKALGHGDLAKRFAVAMSAVKKSPEFAGMLQRYGVHADDY